MSLKKSELEFLQKIQQFTKDSCYWCISESEKATLEINQITSFLVNDAERIASLSKSTVELLHSLVKQAVEYNSKVNKVGLNSLLGVFSKIQAESQEISQMLEPIVQNLQFQDRIRQRLENLSKVIVVWQRYYESVENAKDISINLIDFGNELLGCTTMIDERTIIRKFIAGLKEEEAPSENVLFSSDVPV